MKFRRTSRRSLTTKPDTGPTIDEYLHQRLMPVEGAIPNIAGIEMFGNSIPVGTVGGDLFEYIKHQFSDGGPVENFVLVTAGH